MLSALARVDLWGFWLLLFVWWCLGRQKVWWVNCTDRVVIRRGLGLPGALNPLARFD